MIKFTKLVGISVLILIILGIAQNAFNYFLFGGLDGGLMSTGLVAIAHLVGVVLCAMAIKTIWAFNTKDLS